MLVANLKVSKKMVQLPQHGRIDCTQCFHESIIEFDKTRRTENEWRITANPLAWGNTDAEIVVLGFSKGPTQAGALTNSPHDEIAYKGSRNNVGKILSHIGVLTKDGQHSHSENVTRAIADTNGRFHFGSLIRCAVERLDAKDLTWKGTGGGMLDKFVATDFGKTVANNCTKKYLGALPEKTKLVVMFGLGSGLNYVQSTFMLYQQARTGDWRWLNDVAYTDGKIVVVHVEHFASQGHLIPDWLGENNDSRSKYGLQAQHAVELDLGNSLSAVAGIDNSNISLYDESKAKTMNAPKMKANNLISNSECGSILTEIEMSGYKQTHTNKYLTEFKSPTGQTIYLKKSGIALNNINLFVHPSLNSAMLLKLDGVESVSNEHRFHSNMPKFPKKINTGKDEITYGWMVNFNTFGSLVSFLNAFKIIGIN